MSNEDKIKQQFEKIIEIFFGTGEQERESVEEIVLKGGSKIYFLSNGDWNLKEIDFEIKEEDMNSFQSFIIEDKYSGDESLLDEFESDFKKKGHANYSFVLNNIPLRINWSLGRGKSYMRIRKLPFRMYKPNEIGIPCIIQEEIRKYKQGGLIIVSARPGSGKSTTIASVIQDLANEEIVNIITLEDPIEYLYSKESNALIEQREKGFDFDIFETGVEACLRQTPQIVVVQEMTNNSVIEAVMQLVEKGVMVITTLHTSDATSIFESILGAFPNDRRKEILNKLATGFRCFISQKLIPNKDGNGKIAVFEVLVNNSEAKGNILSDNTKNLHQIMNSGGNILMSDSIIDAVKKEKISLKDGLENCPYSRLEDLKEKVGLNQEF